MKVEFNEWTEGADIVLIPENMMEVQKLLRFAKNAKREPAEITFNFGHTMGCSVFHKKINRNFQTNYIKRGLTN